MVLSFIPTFLLTKNFETWQLYLNVFCLGGLLFTIYPVAMALVCDRVDEKDLIRATGILTFVYGLGSVLGPTLTPYFAWINPDYIPLSLATGLSSVLVAALIAWIWSSPSKQEDKVDFVPLPRGPLTDQLNPNIDEN